MSVATNAVRYVISGRVQGVYYRSTTARRATELAIRGWVRNLPDGCVEVVALGSTHALTELTAWLWQGPPAARIDSVYVEQWEGAVPGAFGVR